MAEENLMQTRESNEIEYVFEGEQTLIEKIIIFLLERSGQDDV